jgi:hypothetical protein
MLFASFSGKRRRLSAQLEKITMLWRWFGRVSPRNGLMLADGRLSMNIWSGSWVVGMVTRRGFNYAKTALWIRTHEVQ